MIHWGQRATGCYSLGCILFRDPPFRAFLAAFGLLQYNAGDWRTRVGGVSGATGVPTTTRGVYWT